MSMSANSCTSSSLNGHDWSNEGSKPSSLAGQDTRHSPTIQDTNLNAESIGSINIEETPEVKPRQQTPQSHPSTKHSSRAPSHETLLEPVEQGQGRWHATLRQDRIDAPPKVKIAIELPWLDLIKSPEAKGTLARTMEPLMNTSRSDEHNLFTLDRIKPNPDGYHGSPVDQIVEKKNLPFTFRSVVYRGVGSRPALQIEEKTTRPVDTPDMNEKPVTGTTSESYLAAMTDLDRMNESKVDWKKFEQLEKTVWMAHNDPNCPNFIRQGSVTSYMRILKNALAKCKENLEQLKKQADEYYGTHETELTGTQLQKFAHLRLLADDTTNEIFLVEKNVNNTNMAVTETELELLQRKRYPLITPTQVRERYAKQVRVITEMLTLLQELVESAKHDDLDFKVKLFESSDQSPTH